MTTPASWYPDPAGAPNLLRWWDGATWTEHTQPVAPVPVPPIAPGNAVPASTATGQHYADHQAAGRPAGYGYGDQSFGGVMQPGTVTTQAGVAPGAGRSIMAEPILVVSQKRKLIELTNQYAVYGQDGVQIAAVEEVGQSTAKKAVRLLTSYGQFLTHRLEVRNALGQVQLLITRPAKVMKSTVVVQRADGFEIGRLVQRNVFGKIRFGMESGGMEVGSLNAENWRAWNFSIQDHTGAEVARITKTWEGLLTTVFTTADNYVVHIHRQLSDPLLSLVVASALTVDTALKQDSR